MAIKKLKDNGIESKAIPTTYVYPKKPTYLIYNGIAVDNIINQPYLCINGIMIEAIKWEEVVDKIIGDKKCQ